MFDESLGDKVMTWMMVLFLFVACCSIAGLAIALVANIIHHGIA